MMILINMLSISFMIDDIWIYMVMVLEINIKLVSAEDPKMMKLCISQVRVAPSVDAGLVLCGSLAPRRYQSNVLASWCSWLRGGSCLMLYVWSLCQEMSRKVWRLWPAVACESSCIHFDVAWEQKGVKIRWSSARGLLAIDKLRRASWEMHRMHRKQRLIAGFWRCIVTIQWTSMNCRTKGGLVKRSECSSVWKMAIVLAFGPPFLSFWEELGS